MAADPEVETKSGTDTPEIEAGTSTPEQQQQQHHHHHHHFPHPHAKRFTQFIHPHSGKTVHVCRTPEQLGKRSCAVMNDQSTNTSHRAKEEGSAAGEEKRRVRCPSPWLHWPFRSQNPRACSCIRDADCKPRRYANCTTTTNLGGPSLRKSMVKSMLILSMSSRS